MCTIIFGTGTVVQLMIELSFPSANKTITFVLDTLRRTTLVTRATRDALGVGRTLNSCEQSSFGECVELPAARIGRERGDHYLVVIDALVANPEQASPHLRCVEYAVERLGGYHDQDRSTPRP